MAKFLEYVPGESFLHRMNPCVKLIGAVLIAIACFVTSNLVFLLILLAAALVMAASCGLGRETAGLCKAVFAFSLILAVVILLTTPHGALLVPLPWGYIGAGSLLAALTVVVRLMAAAIPVVTRVLRHEDERPDERGRQTAARALQVRVHVHEHGALHPRVHERHGRHHGGPDSPRRGIRRLLREEGAAHDSLVRAASGELGAQDELRRHRRRGARLQPAYAHERL